MIEKILAIIGILIVSLYGIGIIAYSWEIQKERVKEYKKEREKGKAKTKRR